MRRTRIAYLSSGLITGTVLLACSAHERPAPQKQTERIGETKSAVFVNGGFESGTDGQPPPNWTVTRYRNDGLTLQTPQTRAGLNLQSSPGNTNDLTFTLVAPGGPESEVDPDLGAPASLRWPKFGNAVAIVNQLGDDRNVNSMKQTMTVNGGDIDSVDGLAHVRFALAPVLEDPQHAAEAQPYFFVQLTNLSRGNAILYQDFNFANQPGVPWKERGEIKYTDWALVDIAPGSARLAPGDRVELEIIAGGCSLGQHWGHVYVDGAGASVPGVFVTATGPSAANENTNITYRLTYKNDGANGAGGVVVEFNTPPNTTFSSLNAPPGLNCTTPPAGATGVVRCTVGTLPANGSGSFQITTHINPGTAGSVITAGNYSIDANGISPLLGPKVFTNVTSGVTYGNLGISIDPGAATVAAGGQVQYVIRVTNTGPNPINGATVTDNLPPQITGETWTCTGAGGATCTGSGTGNINDSATTIPVGGTLTYTVTGTVSPTAAAGQLENFASVRTPAGASDPDPSNNSVGNFKRITVANGVSCGTNADCTSNVCAADGRCGIPAGQGPCNAANGSTVCRPGACSANGTCMTPGSCNVDADCSGGRWCHIGTHTCTAKLPNGSVIPTDPPHTNPTLNGDCTAPAAQLTCVSNVCDASDDRCGYANGTGPCSAGNAAVVCRSQACSQNGTCRATNGCNVDADCSAGNWCHIATHVCTPKVVNGNPVPTDPGHTNPTLNGQCSNPVGSLTCVSGVCDTGDDRCGYPNGGPCTAANGGTVCRSGACSANGTCKPPTGCNVDADCASTQWCNVTSHVCTAKISNGSPVPTDPAHTNPTLNGDCTPAAATATCQSGVCFTGDDRCGYPAGTGPCTAANATIVCRTGACSANNTCVAPDACNVDADCTGGEWCHIATHTCTAKIPNGTVVPTDPGHTNPTLNGTCTEQVGTLTCVSGVCDEGDEKCGYADGSGPCTAQNGATVCRSGSCGADGKCKSTSGCNTDTDCSGGQWCNVSTHACTAKLPNGSAVPNDPPHTNPTLDGTCTQEAGTLTCASGVCDTSDNKCGYADGRGPCTQENGAVVCRSAMCSGAGVCKATNGCNVDADCNRETQFCDTGAHACVPKVANGSPIPTIQGHQPPIEAKCTPDVGTIVCVSGVCDPTDNRCGLPTGAGSCTPATGGKVCRSGACDADGKCGLTDGAGPCTSDAACRSNKCDSANRVCGAGCKADSDCAPTDYCKADGTCSPKIPDGDACGGNNQCRSGACNEHVCDSLLAAGNGIGCAVLPENGSSREGTGMAAFGLSLAFASLIRRRRR